MRTEMIIKIQKTKKKEQFNTNKKNKRKKMVEKTKMIDQNS